VTAAAALSGVRAPSRRPGNIPGMLGTWVAFALYAAGALALGWRAHARRDRGTDYWTAGRDLSGPAVGLSISAGFMSVSWSCVYATQLFYWYGVGAIWLITVPWLLALAGIWGLSRRYHALPAFSQPEMVGQRFGAAPRRVLALAVAFVFLVWGGAEIYVAARLLAPSMGVGTAFLIVLIGAVVAGYAMVGGFRAVVSTDRMQYALVALYIGAVAVLAAVSLESTGTGWPAPTVTGARSDRSWTALLAPGGATILLTFAAYLPGWLFETDLWVRVQAARDDRAARRGVLLAALNALLFVGVLPGFIGISALSLYPVEGGVFPAAVGNEGDAIFAALVASRAPGWLSLAVALGLVAAAMSTIDTCTHVMALSLAYDLGGLHRRGHRGERLSAVVTGASVAAACVFALNTESLWDVFYLSSGVLSTTVAFPVAAVFLPWARRRGVTASATAGFATTVLAYFMESRGPLSAIEPAWLADSGLGYILWGLAAAALGYLVGHVSERDR